MNRPSPILEAKQLGFQRNEAEIFSELEFGLKTGEVLQVVGQNGSGKTTLLRILCGLLTPSQGEIYWQGKAIGLSRLEYLTELHYLGHRSGIKSTLTVNENLHMASALVKGGRKDSLTTILKKVGLAGYENVFPLTLSAGQQRRILFAKLLLQRARLWLLDEPFATLDHFGIDLVQTLIFDHLSQGGLVVLTSHQEFDLKGITPQKLMLGSGYA